MSMFLDPEGENARGADEQTYSMSYPSTPSSHATHGGQDVFGAGNDWAAACSSAEESYCLSQSMVWPSEMGVGVQSTQMSSHPMLVDPSLAAFNTTMPASWPSSMGILMPSSTYRETRHDSMLQNCFPQPAFFPTQASTTWDVPHCGVASFRPSYEVSPGQSDFSVSSQTSGIPPSSPYAHSEGCYPGRSSPIIKVEEDHGNTAQRSCSVSSSVSPRAHHSHVNLGDVYNPPDIEDSQMVGTPPSHARQSRRGLQASPAYSTSSSATERLSRRHATSAR